jgi:hypothetical protein
MGCIIAKLLSCRWRRGARCFIMACVLSARALLPGAEIGAQEIERQKNEEAALALWPEAADPQSIMGREMQRLLDFYTARKDPRLGLVTAPMWIASQAAANTERKRADGESQQTAMRLYPDLAVLDSPLNRLFRETYGRYKEVKPDYFSDPRWPIKLAQQCALQLDAQHAIGSKPALAQGAASEVPSTIPAMETSQPAEVPPHPARRWVINGALAILGAALLIAILTRALRSRNPHHDEQDGSSI